ncbi:MAG: hypothetical protein PHT84_02565 [Candidatus Pacebacteria bacterium]|nr:hypothetical protein [Candidatus Paceibacterota bacterium]
MDKRIFKRINIIATIFVCIVLVGAIGFWLGNNAKDFIGSDEVMTTEEIAQFASQYGWTPPYGFAEKQLIQFMRDNPDATPEELEAGAKEVQLKSNIFSTSEIGFSFNYPEDMSVMDGSIDPNDNYRIFVFPDSYKGNEGEDITAVVISASLNQPPETPLEWLEGPESGADMSNGYSELDIDGQKAISMNGANWVVVDTPDNKYQISIATLPGRNPNWSLQNAMKSIVESIVFSKN